MEAELQQQVHRDFTALVHHNSKSTQGLFVATAASLRDHLVRLARWSEGETLNLFERVYQRMAVLAREPIHRLYSDIVGYLDGPDGADGADAVWLSSPPLGPSMSDSVTRFFAKLFPLTFHTTVAPVKKVVGGGAPQRQLDPVYEGCLAAKMAEVQPFGDSPRALAQSLGRALEAARVLLGVLRVGADVLNSTDSLLVDSERASENNVMPSCSWLLLRLWSCPRCAGLGGGLGAAGVRPCQGYCLNVLRGCVTSRAAELDQPWHSLVEAAAKLAGAAAAAPAYPGRPRPAARAVMYQLNAEEAIRQMENKISEAIMYAMENGPAVERKLKAACGPPKWLPESLTTPSARLDVKPALPLSSSSASTGSSASALQFVTTLRELQDSLLQSRNFYADLADVLCADESFAAGESEPCWNGQRVAEYAKTVVQASASAQRYNPELPWSPRDTEPRIAQLGDKLRHFRQLVVSQLAQAPESDSFVRDRDEEGSGSGASGHDVSRGGVGGVGGVGGDPQWSDDEDRNHVAWPEEGSGSGDDGLPEETSNGDGSHSRNNWTSKPFNTNRVDDLSQEKTSGAPRIVNPQTSLILWVLSLTLFRIGVL